MPNRTIILICSVLIVSLIGAVIAVAYRDCPSNTAGSFADTPRAVMDKFQSLMANSQFNDAAAMIALPAALRQDDRGDWVFRAPGTVYPHICAMRGTADQWSQRFAHGKIVSYTESDPDESRGDMSFRLQTGIMCDPATMGLSFSTNGGKILGAFRRAMPWAERTAGPSARTSRHFLFCASTSGTTVWG